MTTTIIAAAIFLRFLVTKKMKIEHYNCNDQNDERDYFLKINHTTKIKGSPSKTENL